jgi:hypothetical protein
MKAESWQFILSAKCDAMRVKLTMLVGREITEPLASSPDESPTLRTREDGFSGLIFDLAAFPWVSVDLA